MANIQQELDQIRNAVYGEEVRGSIVSALEAINTALENIGDIVDRITMEEGEETDFPIIDGSGTEDDDEIEIIETTTEEGGEG